MKHRRGFFGIQLFLTLLTCAFLLVPILLSAVAGVTVNFFVGVKSGLTVRWIGEVWALYRDTIFRTLSIGVSCLGVTLILGVPAAYTMVKKKHWITRLLEEFLVIPVAIPGLAIALALLMIYGGFTDFRRGWLFILVGHILFTLPFMVRSVIAVMSSITLQEFEEGAASLGAGFWQRFFQIVVPNSMSGILAGSLMVLTISIGEFNLTWMLHTPMTKTLPVGLADSYASMRLEIGSAYTIIFFVLIIPLLIAMQWLAQPRQKTGMKDIDTQHATQLTSLTPKSKVSETSLLNTGKTVTTGISVRLEECAKTFEDGTRALEPCNLTINAGETVVILGPSGCGKTTLLRIIAGLEMPDDGGKVFFEDEDMSDLPVEKRNVGMVFQSYALFPNMNVAENIAYGLKIRGIKGAERDKRVHEMLAMMHIESLTNRRIDQLSGGQKQRVALARAIAIQPKVLLLDEPLTALDAKLREFLRIEIDTLLRSLGITAIYVTHDQAEAMSLGDRIFVMDHGRVVQIGTPREIYFQPKNQYVARFIGTINHLSCVIREENLVFPGGSIPLEDVSELYNPDTPTVELFFRPEDAMIVENGHGCLSATVISAFFMGNRTRIVAEHAPGEPIIIDTEGRVSQAKGQTIDINIDPSALITFHE
jgi:ABC-type Fe3+/spermidine/putrescine transport system ATPase subunit/ABC-type spermidine/putrescine transport system permease subunit II